jgi:lactate dehydrogenase-like 2-hydroxyacid dehydrogenase
VKESAPQPIISKPPIKKAKKIAKKLKLIQVPWTGVDRLDFELLKKFRDVIICNSHSNCLAVAEYAVALLFDLVKKISYHDQLLRDGNWNRPSEAHEVNYNIFSSYVSNKKVGILGYGNIGKKIKKILNGFDCSFYIVNELILS